MHINRIEVKGGDEPLVVGGNEERKQMTSTVLGGAGGEAAALKKTGREKVTKSWGKPNIYILQKRQQSPMDQSDQTRVTVTLLSSVAEGHAALVTAIMASRSWMETHRAMILPGAHLLTGHAWSTDSTRWREPHLGNNQDSVRVKKGAGSGVPLWGLSKSPRKWGACHFNAQLNV